MPARCFDAQVFSRTQVAPAIHRLTVRWPETVPMPHAGQFCMLRAWGRDEAPLLSRPISVHEAYPIRGDEPICENGQPLQLVTFLFEVKGRGTGCLAQLEAGDTLQITGPAGNGFDFSGLAKGTKVALVGGGIGTAPLYQAARELAAMDIRADVYYGFRDEPYEMEPYRHTAGVVRVATDSGRVAQARGVRPGGLLRPRGNDAPGGCHVRPAEHPLPGKPGKENGLRHRRVPGLHLQNEVRRGQERVQARPRV